jgi:hypothetical protein
MNLAKRCVALCRRIELRTYSDFEEDLIGWIAECQHQPRSHLTVNTLINDGGGLGIDGDDAVDLLRYLGNKTGISMATFEYDRFFGSEGVPWGRIADWIRGRRRWRLEPLTIGMLAEYIWAETNK